MEKEVKILSNSEIRGKLKDFSGWAYRKGKLSKQFKFKNFSDAVNFVHDLMPFCEGIVHHPDIQINYNKITFELVRYDVGMKVTNFDFEVAQVIEYLYKGYKKLNGLSSALKESK